MNAEHSSAVDRIVTTVIEFCVNYSFQVVGAVVILIVGAFAANWTASLVLNICEKRKLDVTLTKFFSSIAKLLVLVFAILIALSKFGITIAPFIAAISAAAFGASFAIQGPLSNYGAGLSIILSRPFTVGSTITVAGVHGVVEDIKLACTVLTDEDGVKITIPNKHIVGEIIHNSKTNKIVEGTMGISYDSDPEKAIQIIQDVLHKSKEVSQDPRPQVGVQEFGDYSINIGYRYWVPTVRYFQIMTKTNLEMFKALDAASGIQIPFPRYDVNILSKNVSVNN